MARGNRWTQKAVSITGVGAALDVGGGCGFYTITGSAGGRTITSITNGSAGHWVVLVFGDGNVSITTAAANLNGAVNAGGTTGDVLFLGTADGTNWYEAGRSRVAGTTGPISATTGTFSGAITPTGGVAAAGGFSIDPKLIHTGSMPARVNTDGTDATPVATEVYFAEVFIPANTSVTGVSVFNGSVASGNMKVGLANSAGAVVATSASTAMSGTDVYQRIAFTAPYAAKGPATYYVLQFLDNNTARINCHTFGDFIAGKQTGQTYVTGFTTITPGTTFTTALGPIASLY